MFDGFILGAPKCATTSLYHYLQQHPNIACPAPKESHMLLHGGWGPDVYLSPEEAVFGPECNVDVGVRYLYHDYARKQLDALAPEARCVIMLRDPIDLMHSMHSQSLKGGTETETDFQKAMEPNHWYRPKSDRPGAVPYRELGRLRNAVARWESLGDRLLVLHLQHLRDDFQGTMNQIAAHFGQAPISWSKTAIHNPDTRPRSHGLHHFLHQPPKWTRAIPAPLRNAVGPLLDSKNKKLHQKPEIPFEFRAELAEEYAEDIAFVNSFLQQ